MEWSLTHLSFIPSSFPRLHLPTMPTAAASNRHHPTFSALLCACIALCLSGASPDAHAARKKTGQTDPHSTSAAAQKKGSIKTKHYRSPSEESTADRDRRMYRECWGRPNAGACSGYTRR